MVDDDPSGVPDRLSPKGRDALRRVLIADQPDGDALALRLLHEGTEHAAWLAALIDTLTLHPDERGRVMRLLGELEARRLNATAVARGRY